MSDRQNNRGLSLRRLSAYVGLGFGSLVLMVALFILIFGGSILNGSGKKKLERVFAEAHPGQTLQIGELDYAILANRLIALSITLKATNSTLTVERISLNGLRWWRLICRKVNLPDVFSKASLDAINLDMEYPVPHYGIRCSRLQATRPDSGLTAEGIELRSTVGDEERFAAGPYRTTRFHVVVPQCNVQGLDYGELLRGTSYQARSVHLSSPSFDALVNRDKPVGLVAKPPLMLQEALAAIPRPLRIDSLNITGGYVKYGERVVAKADPGALTFTAVNISVENIVNHSQAPAVISLEGQGNLMDAGALKVLMTIPVASPDFSFHYSGSLGPMDLTRLDAFLDIAEHTRIKSGRAQKTSFEIAVTDGHAIGRVQGIYRDLKIAVLDKQNGSEKGLDNRLASLLANTFRIRDSNTPDGSHPMREGKVNYARTSNDEFMQFFWFALRSGVLDLINQ